MPCSRLLDELVLVSMLRTVSARRNGPGLAGEAAKPAASARRDLSSERSALSAYVSIALRTSRSIVRISGSRSTSARTCEPPVSSSAHQLTEKLIVPCLTPSSGTSTKSMLFCSTRSDSCTSETRPSLSSNFDDVFATFPSSADTP